MSLPEDVVNYLHNAPAGRQEVLSQVFETVRAAVPQGYELSIAWGMPTWSVPLSRFPDTYNGQPLAYVAVGAQKNYVSVYLMGLYSQPDAEQDFRTRWKASTGKLDMGKSCLRLKKPADVDTGLLAEAVASTSVEEFIATYERAKR